MHDTQVLARPFLLHADDRGFSASYTECAVDDHESGNGEMMRECSFFCPTSFEGGMGCPTDSRIARSRAGLFSGRDERHGGSVAAVGSTVHAA